ncbi:hypothetical protein DY000_02040174 [Brassica cretica]|uniref:Uncharacterized protein n=1 Tax=Brassica cretica TaxID=69181 RepID=A0ABQ7BMY9_BRACR|nr:hypothetical protein DY000_02040174 [Brassica cretica]
MSNKENKLSFSDPARLECTIRKEKQAASINTTSSSLIDTICERGEIITTQASIDTNPQASNMAVSFTKDVEVVDVDNDKGDKANVNYISGIGFQSQRFGNQSGNRKFIGTVQKIVKHEKLQEWEFQVELLSWCCSTPTPEHRSTSLESVGSYETTSIDRHPASDDRHPSVLITYHATKGQIYIGKRKKKKVHKYLRRKVNDKEMYSFTKRVLRIFGDKSFNEAYYTPKLWMFFRESRETKDDIECIFHQIIVSIIHRVMANHVSLNIEPSGNSFTFVDCSKVNSGGIVRNLQDEMIINVPREDIEAILEMADNVVGHYLSLPQNEGWFQMPRFAEPKLTSNLNQHQPLVLGLVYIGSDSSCMFGSQGLVYGIASKVSIDLMWLATLHMRRKEETTPLEEAYKDLSSMVTKNARTHIHRHLLDKAAMTSYSRSATSSALGPASEPHLEKKENERDCPLTVPSEMPGTGGAEVMMWSSDQQLNRRSTQSPTQPAKAPSRTHVH